MYTRNGLRQYQTKRQVGRWWRQSGSIIQWPEYLQSSPQVQKVPGCYLGGGCAVRCMEDQRLGAIWTTYVFSGIGLICWCMMAFFGSAQGHVPLRGQRLNPSGQKPSVQTIFMIDMFVSSRSTKLIFHRDALFTRRTGPGVPVVFVAWTSHRRSSTLVEGNTRCTPVA